MAELGWTGLRPPGGYRPTNAVNGEVIMADLWEEVGNSQVLAVHAALLPNGKVLYFSGSQHDETPASVDATRLWEPESGRVTRVSSPTVDLFCCGHCLLPGGELLVAGGTAEYDVTAPAPHRGVHHFTGIASCNVFDVRDESWHSARSMSGGRWYPTCVTLHNGRALAMSGHTTTGPIHENTTLEIFNPASGMWSTPMRTTPPLEDTGGTLLLGGVLPMVYYPRLHVLPNGQIFSSTALRAGGTRMTRTVNPRTGSLTSLSAPPRGGDDLTNMNHVYARAAFASVLLPLKPPNYSAKILICGQKQAKVFELNNPHLGWQDAGGPRPYPMRAYLNAVILPDASVLVVGGAKSERGAFGPLGTEIGGEDKDAVPFAERYLPDSKRWITLSAPNEQPAPRSYQPIARVYHSVTLLLPDGRVWIAGSNHDSRRNKGGVREDDPSKGDARELRMEVYSPPYLFNGVDGAGNPIPAKRPKVERVRLGASYGQRFTIHTPEAREIATVVLIRCSSVTHNFNPDQRYVGLVVDKVTRTLTSLTVNAPPTPEIAPPGYYMLFILTGGEK